nr:tyrosine-type recombinase/integrase [Paracoccus sp. PAR01]
MVKALNDAPLVVRSAAELILGTGQRPAAAIAMRRDQFNGEWMTVTDEKGDETYEIFCPVVLRRYLDTLPVGGAHVLARNLTQPMRYDSVEKQFRAWRESLGDRAKPYSMHGLRKLAIVRLAEAECTDAQIQAITNQSPQTVAYYRKRASRKKLSRSAWSGPGAQER